MSHGRKSRGNFVPRLLHFPNICTKIRPFAIWKLKGTGKQNRLETIASCTKEQPVFIICNSNGSNCTVITENGDEIGKLNKTDAKLYHQYVEKFRYHVYIKSIKRELEKPRVRILVIVHERPEPLRP